ncbi:unnamed protein product [Cylindrotheca closterium]|uniref:Class I SAM-dependent methyltransferase n=1 Tax=Cylindrotheca closterium TaxID=2856 RepID=A0AAD2FWW6_9STRA|nr:unnamed protein product [Cylindrotheca closterium]
MPSPRQSRQKSPIRSNGPNREILSAIVKVFFTLISAYCLSDFVGEMIGRSLQEDEMPMTTKSFRENGAGMSTGAEDFERIIKQKNGNWSETEIVTYMTAHPQRNYFSHLFAYGGFRRGIEIGVQDGRFSEVFMQQNSKLMNDQWTWVLVEPNPTKYLNRRLGLAGKQSKWAGQGYLENCTVNLQKTISTNPALLDQYPDGYFDFVYLDASHTYDAVRAELPLWWKKVRSGGIISGHDYCNYGEPGQSCNGCKLIPQCQDYTGWGVESAVFKTGRSSNQNGVVRAVQDWMVQELGNPFLTVRHTIEDFTQESLTKDGFDFGMVLRRDRNPSWYIYKP